MLENLCRTVRPLTLRSRPCDNHKSRGRLFQVALTKLEAFRPEPRLRWPQPEAGPGQWFSGLESRRFPTDNDFFQYSWQLPGSESG